MRNHTLWSMTQQTWEAILPTYQPVFAHYCVLTELEPATLGLLLAAVTFHPEPITVKKLQGRDPYTAEARYEEQLQLMTTKGYLSQIRPGAYTLTDFGSYWLDALLAAGRAAMAEADPLPRPKVNTWRLFSAAWSRPAWSRHRRRTTGQFAWPTGCCPHQRHPCPILSRLSLASMPTGMMPTWPPGGPPAWTGRLWKP